MASQSFESLDSYATVCQSLESIQNKESIDLVSSLNTELVENNDHLKPKIIVKLTDKKSEINEKAMFICEYSSSSESKICWHHNGSIIKQSSIQKKYLFQNESHRSTITILNIEFEDIGDYEFIIQNKYGNASSKAKLVLDQSKIKIINELLKII